MVCEQSTQRERVAQAERRGRRGLSEAKRSAYQYSVPTADYEFYQATSVISRRRRIYARIADLSANSPSMRFPGR
jgi:hypothetical protein